MKLPLLLIYLLVSTLSMADTVDSLYRALSKSKNANERMKIKIEIGENVPIFRITYWDSIQLECKNEIVKAQSEQDKLDFGKHRAGAVNNMGFIYDNQGDIKKAIDFYEQSLAIRKEVNDKEGLALAYNNIGSVYLNQGKDVKALEYFNDGLKIQEEIGDKKGIAYSLINIGGIYDNQGDIPKALEYFHKSLKINEERNDLKAIAYSLSNIGAINNNQGELDQAIEDYKRCLELRRKVNDQIGIATSLNKLGNIYQKQNKFTEALKNYTEALKIQEEIQEKQGALYSLNNIGSVYLNIGDPDCSPQGSEDCKKKGNAIAFEYFQKSLKIGDEIGNKSGLSTSLSLLASCLINQNNFPEALKYGERSLVIAKELGYPDNIKGSALNLKKIYQNLNQPAKALEMLELYYTMRDSISNQENRKATQKQQFKYEWEKRESQIAGEKHKQQLVLIFVIVGLVLVIVFSGFLYNRFRITNQQKKIIEEKNKEITDSIHYASRIQRAMLTSQEYIHNNLNAEFFILYQPKDIVSGDFYWATFSGSNFYLATADCTGHGVPGAFMSLLNMNLLQENIVEKNLYSPAEIFNRQRERIIKALNPKGDENSKDGMDCTLCKYELNQDGSVKRLFVSAANNSVYHVRNKELKEFKPNKMPIGLSGQEDKNFSEFEVEIKKGDIIYTYTDGYADQFGGPKGKKFMYKKFKEILVANSNESMARQKELLKAEMDAWMAHSEQIDDILVIGIKI